MSDRLNPAEREAAQAEIIGLTNTGVELADLALNNLEFRANPQVLRLNSHRLNRLSTSDQAVLNAIAERFAGVNVNQETLNDYTLEQFQTDFLFLAQFFRNPQRSEIEQRIRTVSAEDFSGLQSQWQAAIAARVEREEVREVQGTEAEMPDETPGLGLRRIEMLAAPELNIGSVVQAVRAEIETSGLDNAQAMQMFRARLVPQVVERLEAWGRDNNNFVRRLMAQQGEGSPTGQSEAEMLESMTGITTIGESVAGDAVEGAGNLLGNLGGDLNTALQYNFIENDPLLGQLFNDANSKQPLMESLFSGDFDAQLFTGHISEQLESLFPDSLDFARIHEQFGTWAGFEDNQLTAEDLQDIRDKLETIPRFFIGGEWEDKYHEYVRHEVAGKGALDFPEWILTQVDGLQRIFFSILVNPMVVTAMNWWYNDSEDTDEQRYGEHWAQYNGLEANAPEERGGLRDEQVPPGGADVEDAALITAYPLYGNLLTAYREQEGDDAQLNIQINGQPLTPENVEDEAVFTRILSLTETPDRRQLLNKGLELSNLDFIAQNLGDNNANGVNIYVENGEIRFSPNLGEYTFGQENDLPAEIGEDLASGAIGGLAARWAYIRYLVPRGFSAGRGRTRIITAAGALLAGLFAPELSRLDSFFFETRTFDLETLSSIEINQAVQEIQRDVGLLEETYERLSTEDFRDRFGVLGERFDNFDWENIDHFPEELIIGQNELSPAFGSLLGLDEAFWGDYQMTQADLNAFVSNLDNGITDWGYVDNEAEAFEANDALNPFRRRQGGFMVEGGTFMDHRFDNVEQFFTWLRS